MRKIQSTTDKKKVKQIFQTKKGFITCLKLMITELTHSSTTSENVYFANNEQDSIAVFMPNIIKLKLYNNWSAQAVNSVLCEFKETNQICSPLKISQSVNAE